MAENYKIKVFALLAMWQKSYISSWGNNRCSLKLIFFKRQLHCMSLTFCKRFHKPCSPGEKNQHGEKLHRLKCKSNLILEAGLDKHILALLLLLLLILIITTVETTKYFKIFLVSCYLAKCKLLTFSSQPLVC